MDPFIELPEAARARIRAKEARADEQLNIVRRACEADVARATRQWGGYFDLHQDDLADARAEARAQLDEVAVLSAQFVFLAHATEYREVLPTSSELEPVLAKLREAVIKRYGEQTRGSIQRLEAEEVEKKSPEIKVGLVGGHPIQDIVEAVPDMPQLSAATNRKLAIQWEELLDQHRLTGEWVDRYASVSDRIRQLAVSEVPKSQGGRWLDSWLTEHQRAKQESGISASLAVAKERFMNLSSEYRVLWAQSGAQYDTYASQMEILKGRVLAELSSIWKRSTPTCQWYETTCASVVERVLATLVRERVREARQLELQRLGHTAETGNPILDEIHAAAGSSVCFRQACVTRRGVE